LPIVVEKVSTVVTPGETVDVLVTERGICVNPKKPELEEKLKAARLNVRSIQDLQQEVAQITGEPKPVKFSDKVVALIEYRDGTIIDVIRQTID
jgi:citrate lyase subunit alpha/citrate CoA-transferase